MYLNKLTQIVILDEGSTYARSYSMQEAIHAPVCQHANLFKTTNPPHISSDLVHHGIGKDADILHECHG